MTAQAEPGQTPRGAPSPANHKPHMKLRSTASTLLPSRPDFLNSLGYEPPLSGELVEQRFGLFEIGGVEAFGDGNSRPLQKAEFASFLRLSRHLGPAQIASRWGWLNLWPHPT